MRMHGKSFPRLAVTSLYGAISMAMVPYLIMFISHTCCTEEYCGRGSVQSSVHVLMRGFGEHKALREPWPIVSAQPLLLELAVDRRHYILKQ
jgi:hypothetical protein